jgi:osmotically-inducible protein OsmY
VLRAGVGIHVVICVFKVENRLQGTLPMTRRLENTVAIVVLLCSALVFAQKQPTYSPKAQARITKEVQHQILMLPDFGVFDNIAFQLKGYDVVLLGHVVNASLKDSAEHVVKKIEGVERVENRIEVLSASPGDDRLRRDVFIAIYRYGPLQHYGVGSNRPIHIIVNKGRVMLEGVVDRQSDKNLAGIRANGVPGVFSVQNNLVVPGKSH